MSLLSIGNYIASAVGTAANVVVPGSGEFVAAGVSTVTKDWTVGSGGAGNPTTTTTSPSQSQLDAQAQSIRDSLNQQFQTDAASYAKRASAAGVSPTTGLAAHSDANVAKITAYEVAQYKMANTVTTTAATSNGSAVTSHPIIASIAAKLPASIGDFFITYPLVFDGVVITGLSAGAKVFYNWWKKRKK